MKWVSRKPWFIQLLLFAIVGAVVSFSISEIRDGTLISTVTPDFVEYRRFSAENLPISFNAPRSWKIDTDEPDTFIVGKRQAGIDNAVGIVVTVIDKAEYMGDAGTLFERLTQHINQENARPLPEPLVAGQSGIVGSTQLVHKDAEETPPFQALHMPIPIEESDSGITWLFVPYVGYRSGIFSYYFVAMRATAEINNQVIEIQASCFGGIIDECQRLLLKTVHSVEVH